MDLQKVFDAVKRNDFQKVKIYVEQEGVPLTERNEENVLSAFSKSFW
jgi:hypothetical protein